jgi:predicted acetyltransferase
MLDELRDRQRTAAIDDRTRTTLASRGFTARLVPAADDAFPDWLRAVRRGFLEDEPSDEQTAATAARSGYKRNLGVYDALAGLPAQPIGTITSWATELSVPGERGVPAVAISAVTVAQTHRRRGIARTMVESELRTAAACGIPIAVLTVSESTLYGRYGFAPAAAAASWTIECRRAGWVGPEPIGRVDFVARDRLRELAPALHERVRLTSPGELEMPGGHWDRFAGTREDAERAGRLRALQWADDDGVVRGVALYTVTEGETDFTKSRVDVQYLLTETDAAYSALWQFLLGLDLVAEVRARELSTDEPLRWMIADQRAATVTVTDHQYVRVIDVPAALEARAYDRPGAVAFEVSDPIGLSGGRWLLRVGDDGIGRVQGWEHASEVHGVPLVRLGVAELSAAYLGGVSLLTLARAGRLEASDAAAASSVLSSPTVPRLSFWY